MMQYTFIAEKTKGIKPSPDNTQHRLLAFRTPPLFPECSVALCFPDVNAARRVMRNMASPPQILRRMHDTRRFPRAPVYRAFDTQTGDHIITLANPSVTAFLPKAVSAATSKRRGPPGGHNIVPVTLDAEYVLQKNIGIAVVDDVFHKKDFICLKAACELPHQIEHSRFTHLSIPGDSP